MALKINCSLYENKSNMKKTLLLICWVICTSSLFGQNIEGSWSGLLEAGNQKIRLTVNLSQQDAMYSGSMDSPDQGVKGIPLSKVYFCPDTLLFEIQQLGVIYKGAVKCDTLISGTFTQSGISFPLNLSKGATVVHRPQEPKPPYPYHTEDVYFPSRSTEVTLAGTLSIPKTEKDKYPAVILVTGSGPQNRDEEILDHKPFLVIADYLTRNGIAVLRYDDRGTYESTGDFQTAVTKDFADDALGAFDFLLSRPEIDNSKIGILGHSEGGTVAFIAAADNPEIAFVISLAGAAIRGDSIMIQQNYDILLAQGVPENIIQIYCSGLYNIFEILKNESDQAVIQNRKHDILTKEEIEMLPEQLYKNLIGILSTPLSPWMKYFLSFDPAPYIESVRCPVLAFNGKLDTQVKANINLAAIETALKKRDNLHFTTKEYESLNHLFQNSTIGLSIEYGQIEETISPEILKDIYEWISSL